MHVADGGDDATVGGKMENGCFMFGCRVVRSRFAIVKNNL